MMTDGQGLADLEYECTEGFRETMLVNFRPKQARALRRLARMLSDYAIDATSRRLPTEESWSVESLEAAARDLTHLGLFLRSFSEIVPEEKGMTPERAARLEKVAVRSAHLALGIAKDLDDALREKEFGHVPQS
jgi:hypothetical protein